MPSTSKRGREGSFISESPPANGGAWGKLRKAMVRKNSDSIPPDIVDADNWMSREPRHEGWLDTAQEMDLANLTLLGETPGDHHDYLGAQGHAEPDSTKAPPLLDTQCLTEGFHIESCRSSVTTSLPEDSDTYALESTLLHFPHFRTYLAGKDHMNLFGEDANDGPVLVSVLLEKEKTSEFCKTIVRTKREDRRIFLPYSSNRKDFGKALKIAMPNLQVGKFHEIKDAGFSTAMVAFEEQLTVARYKFGVLLCTDGQKEENEMFSNVNSTPEFDEFLSNLGEKIELKGWKSFRGGLDVSNNSTGTHSVYTTYRDLEVMFHVSTLLPFQPDDVQKVERKRHIGNDIVTVIFKHGNAPFSPLTLTTKFTHIFCVVQKVPSPTGSSKTCYKVSLAHKPGVRPYTPFLNKSGIYEAGPEFKDFMLSKLINSERAAVEAPEFKNKLVRTRKGMMDELVNKYCK